MSGYGGQPSGDPGWEDPYQSRQPGWSTPYGHYGRPQHGPYGYGYGPPGVAGPAASHGAAVAALVCNIIAMLFCIVAVGGIVTAAIAMGRTETDPASARNLTKWSWILFGISVGLTIVMVIAYIAFFLWGVSSGGYGLSA